MTNEPCISCGAPLPHLHNDEGMPVPPEHQCVNCGEELDMEKNSHDHCRRAPFYGWPVCEDCADSTAKGTVLRLYNKWRFAPLRGSSCPDFTERFGTATRQAYLLVQGDEVPPWDHLERRADLGDLARVLAALLPEEREMLLKPYLPSAEEKS